MGFKAANMAAVVRFNSANSSNFLDAYETYLHDTVQSSLNRPKLRTFAPSSFRCARKNWFRLRGTAPDVVQIPDLSLQHTAEVGTARHTAIQSKLSKMLGQDWIDVETYLSDIPDYPYDYTIQKDGFESRISIQYPPIKFACDGIVRWNNKLYLLEIKTSEYSSWEELTDPKSVHMDQVMCYSTLLQLPDVLMLYEDRQYGGMKCYEEHFSIDDMMHVKNKFDYIMEMVDHNLAPEKLPHADYMCRNCEYQKKCAEWG